MTRAGKLGEAVGVAAAKGLLWSVNRLIRVLGFILGLYIYARLFRPTVAPETRPSPLLIDATISDLMLGAITPVIIIIIAWKLLTDD